MKQIKEAWRILALALALVPLAAWLGAGLAAQGVGTLTGEVRDQEAKPFPDVTIIIKNADMGQTFEVKTDKNGRFLQAGLRGGVYIISVKIKGQIVYEMNARVQTGAEEKVSINFKELKEKGQAQALEAQKKQEEEKKQFESLKAHFDSGRAALEQARQARNDMQRAAADQRAALQEKVNELSGTAISEFQVAEKATGEKDANRHIVLAKLGESYETAGRFEEAAAAYQKAIELKPDEAGYYNNLGNTLARLGKIQEAGAAYEKSASLDPPNAASAWRNFGIVLYNANKMKEAVEPLRKALALDPKSAQAWYLIGGALVNTMEYKKEGDKYIPVLQPGTLEAYQKAMELDPNGVYGLQAKQGLEALEQMGVGIQIKVKSRAKK